MKRKVIIGGVIAMSLVALLAWGAMAQMGGGMGPGRGSEMGPGRCPGECCGQMGMGFGPFWKDPDVAAKLKLTPDQISKLDKLESDHVKGMIDLKAEVEKAEFDFRQAMDDPHPDAAKAKKAADVMFNAHKKTAYAAIDQHIAVTQILTAEQMAQLKNLHREFRKEHREQFRHDHDQGKDQPQTM